jgi:hypothetical protein
MIDFGLVGMFALQFLLAAAVYHVYRDVRAEIKGILDLRHGMNDANEAVADMGKRLDAHDAAPAALVKRIVGVEDSMAEAERARIRHQSLMDKTVDSLSTRVTSLGARLSAFKRFDKKNSDEETDPALEGEVEGQGESLFPPGSFSPEQKAATNTGIPPGFGMVSKRRVA